MTLTIREAQGLKGSAVAVDAGNVWEHKRTLDQLARWSGPATKVIIRDVLANRPHPSGHGKATTVLVEEVRGPGQALVMGGASSTSHATAWEVLPKTIGGPWHEYVELCREVVEAATLEGRSVAVAAALGEGWNGTVWEGRHRVSAPVEAAERVARSLLRARTLLRDALAGEGNVVAAAREAMRWIDEATDVDTPTKHRRAVHDAEPPSPIPSGPGE